MTLLKQIFGCTCNPPPDTDRWNDIEKEINNNTDRITRIESRTQMKLENLESKLELKWEMMNNTLDNVLMILHNNKTNN